MLNRNKAMLYYFRFMVFLCLNIVMAIRKIVKQYFPDVDVSFVFTVPCRLNRFFNVKM